MEYLLKAPINKGAREIKYVIDLNTGCWNVVSHAVNMGGKGYPFCSINNVYWAIHRLSFTLNKGTIPEGMLVRHTCDNKLCCNPEHLILGSYADNSQDALTRNRVHSTFSISQLDYIKRDTGESDVVKAKKLGCSRENIRDIRLNNAMPAKRNDVLSVADREAIKLDSRTKREVAIQYKVSISTVYRIRNS